MEKVIIIGGKSSAKLIADHIYDAKVKFNAKYEFLGFAFDEIAVNSEINGFPVLCNSSEVYQKYEKYKDVKFVFQMYRLDILLETIKLKDSLKIPNSRYLKFIHPSCMVARSAKIGAGTIILANSVVNSNATIGNFNTIVSNVTIGHDAKIGNYNLIATQSTIANITMGDRNFIGINCSTNNYISIGDDCMVGMGSNLLKSIPSGTKCFGNPAKAVDTLKKAL